MSYEEFWERDYRLIESYVLRHNRELDYNAQLLFEMYGYIHSLVQWKAWSESDSKKRGKAPKLPEKFEPVSDRGKYLMKLEEDKNREINAYIRNRMNKNNR